MFKSALERLEEAVLIPPQRKTSEREKKKKKAKWLFLKGIKMGPGGCERWDRNRHRWGRELPERGLWKREPGTLKHWAGEGGMHWDTAGRSWGQGRDGAAAFRLTPVATAGCL